MQDGSGRPAGGECRSGRRPTLTARAAPESGLREVRPDASLLSVSDTCTVAVSDVRRALDRLLAAVERSMGAEIDLMADHYWVVSSADAFDVHVMPAPTVGQLSDDLDEL